MQNMRQHVTIVGALHIGLGALGLLAAFIVFAATAGGGLISGDSEAIRITLLVGSLVGGLLALLSAPSLVAGIGVLRHQNWARIMTLILSAFNLFCVPIGTAIAIYTFWALMQDEAVAMFSRAGEAETP